MARGRATLHARIDWRARAALLVGRYSSPRAEAPISQDREDPRSPHESEDARAIPSIGPDDATRSIAPQARERDPQSLPTEIADYELVRRIGAGGMGEVWEAEQLRPIRRRVALKVIRRGLGGAEIIARFESERQALALMDHPNIANVLGAGEAADGRPYFVMEYVEGVAITEHCDAHQLGTRERLELFKQVCEGVQHAHQKAIIHRDIKPSNVLVTVKDGRAIPKIIDFGVAKATAQRLTERTLFTEIGQLIGTPEYMSPEQADLTGEGIDTRTDVYALGVLLYELLVGERPLDARELRRVAFDEVLRRIREQDPPRPSTRLAMLGADSAARASSRGTDATRLARELRGDLDWVTMKALEKDRERRYSAASELAADVDRFLSHQPVVARPPSASYRLAKFARRHRAGVAVGAAAVLALVGFALFASVQAARIARERDRANLESEASRAVADFLVELFRVSDPSEARGRTVTAREMLDLGAERIRTELADRPPLQARLMGVIGTVYSNLGLYKSAAPLLEESLTLKRRMLGEHHAETLVAEETLGWLMANDGRLAQAESVLVAAVESMRGAFGENDRRTLSAMNDLAVVYQYGKKYAESESLRVITLSRQRQHLGAEHIEVLRSQGNLAFLYNEIRRYREAESLFVLTSEAQRRTLGPDHPETIRALSNLAMVYLGQNRIAEAESLRLATIEAYGRVLGEEHPETLRAKLQLSLIRRTQGRHEEAEAICRGVLEARERIFGDDAPATIDAKRRLANILIERQQFAAAESLFTSLLVAETALNGAESRGAVFASVQIAQLHIAMGRADAESRLTTAMASFARAFGATSVNTMQMWYNSACWAMRARNPELSKRSLAQAVAAGLRDPEFVLADADLAPLHGDPEFEALVAEIRVAESTQGHESGGVPIPRK
jgi:non-specific serine/threonine protein kinase/serine/threonine-protein kinase